MKKILRYGGIVLAVSAIISLSGCFILLGDPGADGRAYVQVNHSSSYGLLAAIQGFPSGWYTATDYELVAGHYDGAYVLYSPVLNGGFYDVTFNGNPNTMLAGYVSVSAAVTSYYTNYFSDDANPISFDITINEGEPGMLFEDGVDGADIYYLIWLAWNPTSSYISHTPSYRGDVKTIVNPDGSTVQELTKGRYTLRLTTKWGGGSTADLPPAENFPPKDAAE